jgi:hypothetical protein
LNHIAEFRVTRVLRRAMSTWWRNLIPFTVLSGIVHAPLVLMVLLRTDGSSALLRSDGVLFITLSSALGLVLHAAITYNIAQQLLGRRIGLTEPLFVVIERLVPLFALGVAYGLLSYVRSSLPLFLGIFGVVAELVVYTIYIVTIPVFVVERAGIIKALEGSRRLTRGYRMQILGVCLLFGVIGFAISLPFAGAAYRSSMADVTSLLPVLGWLFLGPLLGAVIMAIYHELRAVQDGVDLASRAGFPQAHARVKSPAAQRDAGPG